jgi:hypothetical protein
MKKIIFNLSILGLFILFLNSSFVFALSNPSGGLGSSQYYQPSFNTYYSSEQLSNYWPILKSMENGQCQASNDFLVAIPPLGCTPTVVRSDLLEEQNVPVFCQLDALQVNPLIKVSSIESISFKGDYPEEVVGISFHPARAAVNTRETLLGSPLLNNIGYAVIILKRTEAEKDMPDFVKGNLTATIRYDAEEAFGVGKAEFLLPLLSDEEWSSNYKSYGFWNGRGYMRLLSTDGENAEVGVYTDENKLLQKVNLRRGETSGEIYFPGFYCNAGLQLKLNEVDATVDKVRLSVDGQDVWAKAGTKILNGKCTVNKVYPLADGTGTVSISCPAGQKFDLTLSQWGAKFNEQPINVGELVERGDSKGDWYLAFIGKLTDKVLDVSGKGMNGKEFVVLYKSSKSLDQKYLTRVTSAVDTVENSLYPMDLQKFKDQLTSRIGNKDNVRIVLQGENGFEGIAESQEDKELIDSVKSNFTLAKDSTSEIFDFGKEEKDSYGEQFGKKALIQLSDDAKTLGQYSAQKEALEKIVEMYPGTLAASNAQNELDLLEKFDITRAGKGVFVNNKYSYILVEQFQQVSTEEKNIDLNIASGLIEGSQICLDGKEKKDDCSFVFVKKITPAYVDLSFSEWDSVRKRYTTSNKSVRLYEDSSTDKNSELLGGTAVYLRTINVKDEVSVSLIPRVDNTKTEANFTFNIGIEKRSIELSPEKTQQMIKTLNKTISEWEERVEKLGNLVKAWKGACLATSTFMVMSNFATGLSGESIARKNVMEKYKLICEEKVAAGAFKTLSECYASSEVSKQIDSAVELGTKGISEYNEKIKKLEEKAPLSDGKTVNQTKLKELMVSEMGVPNAQYMTVEQIKEYKFWENQAKNSKDGLLVKQAQSKLDSLTKSAKEYEALTKDSDQGIMSLANSAYERAIVSGSATEEAKTKLTSAGVKVNDNEKVMVVTGTGSQKYYVVLENTSTTQTSFIAKGIYAADSSGNVNKEQNLAVDSIRQTLSKQTVLTKDALEIRGITFVTSTCNNPYLKDPIVKYYTAGVDKYLPALVPFDRDEGWYVKVSQGGGNIFSSNADGYSSSGLASTYTICNVGSNGLEENGVGDDTCQTFYSNQDVNEFGGCRGLTTNDVQNLKNKAQRALQEAANQYGKSEVIIGGKKFNSMLTSATDDGIGCYNFMSPTQCKTLFNVCDPVICPPSRCNLAGKYPVANVIQSGIIGSLLLCLPNVREGIYVPICLTGVHAGLESYLSILRSERECLQENLESGKMVGICDEITSVYKCEFFWNQIAPVASSLVPTMFEMASGQSASKGGAEYLSVKSAWDNMQGSIDYFKNEYAQNSFNAFKFKNIQEVGSEFCRASIGTSVPTGADLADSLLEPESPYQFYANFDESVFTDATVPSTSQYKVYYHIFSGNDEGVRYSVYLKNPPASTYYNQNPIVTVKTGYVTRGNEVDEAIDFTAPSGYKELCVMINAQVECGFKSVSTSMGVNYLRDKYVERQANASDITTEKECISGSASVLGMISSPNLQAGAQNSINPDVSLNGIVRVCATENPGKSTRPDQWKPVGTCGNENMKCWLDTKSVNETVSRVKAVEGISLSDAEKATANLEANTKENYATVATKLVKLGDEIKAWKKDSDSSAILTGLSEIIDGSGASNNQLANALYLKTIFHLNVVKAIKVETVQIAAKPTPGVSTASAAAKVDTTFSKDAENIVVDNGKIIIENTDGTKEETGLTISCKESANTCIIRNANAFNCNMNNFICGSVVNSVARTEAIILPEDKIKDIKSEYAQFIEQCFIEDIKENTARFSCGESLSASSVSEGASCSIEEQKKADEVVKAVEDYNQNLEATNAVLENIKEIKADVEQAGCSITKDSSLKEKLETCESLPEFARDSAKLNILSRAGEELEKVAQELPQLEKRDAEFFSKMKSYTGGVGEVTTEDIANGKLPEIVKGKFECWNQELYDLTIKPVLEEAAKKSAETNNLVKDISLEEIAGIVQTNSPSSN